MVLTVKFKYFYHVKVDPYFVISLQGNKDLAGITHVIVDEVHERSLLVSLFVRLMFHWIHSTCFLLSKIAFTLTLSCAQISSCPHNSCMIGEKLKMQRVDFHFDNSRASAVELWRLHLYWLLKNLQNIITWNLSALFTWTRSGLNSTQTMTLKTARTL